jgi:SNF2 family DNA or RNA helicase
LRLLKEERLKGFKMINIKVKRIGRTRFFSLSFPYLLDLIQRVKQYENSKYEKADNSWQVHCLDLFEIIKSYKGDKNIFFKFNSFEERNEFIKIKDKILEEKIEKEKNKSVEEQLDDESKKIKKLDRIIDIDKYKKYLEKDINPFNYQCIGADFLLFRKKAMLGFEQGCGKSITSILACEMSKDIKKVLVVVPNSLKFNYQNEIKKFTKHKKVHIIGYKKNECEIKDAKYIIVNYNFFRDRPTVFKNSFEKKIKKPFPNFDAIILDESQNIKNEKANQTKNLLYTIKQINFPFIFLLTGTPMPSRITELYTQLNLLSPYQIKNKKFYYENYCGMIKGRFGYESHNDINLDILYNKMDGVMFRVKKTDVLKDLPPLLINELYIDMSDEEFNQYDDIESGLKTIDLSKLEISDNLNDKMHFLTILQKLRQYTSSLKINYLSDIIKSYNEEGQKLIIFDEFKSTLKKVYDFSPDNSRLFTGDVDIETRQKNIDDFQRDSQDVMNLLLTVQTGNAGLTLTRASNVFMVTQNYVPSINEQCYARAHRIGQESHVMVYNLIVRDSIDERVNYILKDKKKVIDKVIDNKEYVDESVKIDVIKELIKTYKNKYGK